MLATSQSCAVVGLEGYIVQVEVDISPGLPKFNVVGLPDAAVQEARERVRAALRNSGFEFPMRRITANLAPADLKKAGPAYDLPIAVSILFSSGQAEPPSQSAIFLGELSLDGALRHTNGVLPMVAVAQEQGFESVFVPAPDVSEAALVEGIQVYPVSTLAQLISHLQGETSIAPVSAGRELDPHDDYVWEGTNLAHIRGQEHAKRAMEVAAAGLDHSRHVLAWKLSNTMDTSFCVAALEEALGKGRPEIFNTDQGSQFTSEAFTQTLQEQRVQVSMDGKGRYLDNIFVERLWRSIKYEEVYLKAYQTVAEARTGINTYLEFYNRQRPHQALGYRTPAEVYQHGQEERGAAAEEAGLPSGLVKPSAGVGDSLNLALVLS